MFRGKRILFFLFFILAMCGNEGIAQQQNLLNFRNRGAQYLIGKEDELLIKVNIWGFVRMPGQYLVPSDTDLISLISYAGGPTEGAQTKKVKLVRTTDLTPEGKTQRENKKIHHYNIKKFLETGDLNYNPQLMPNDTILISGSTAQLVSNIFKYLVMIIPIIQAYYWYQVASTR